MPLSYTEVRQIPERSETVTFRGSYQEVLPEQLKKLNASKVYLVVSKSLAYSSNEVEVISNLPFLKDKLVGTKIGVVPHGYCPIPFVIDVSVIWTMLWKSSTTHMNLASTVLSPLGRGPFPTHAKMSKWVMQTTSKPATIFLNFALKSISIAVPS